MSNATQSVNVRLPEETVRYLEAYRQAHGIATRTEVILEAVRALRNKELIEGYIVMSQDLLLVPDLLHSPLRDGLEPSTEETW
jgi:Arc/MetJ-type ribon-helix-helix transcriptional regulator